MARGSCLCGAVAFEIDDAGVVVSVVDDTGPPAFWAGVMQRLFAAR